ncbi:MAG: helix-turn-helix domain-containing protein [bacterium]
MSGPRELPPLLTVADAASLLRTTRGGIYAMAERGQLPGIVRIGRRLLVRRDAVFAWLGLDREERPAC